MVITTFVVQLVLKMLQGTAWNAVSFHESQSPRFVDESRGRFCYANHGYVQNHNDKEKEIKT